MAKIQYGVKTSRKQGGPKMAKIQFGVKPDIFKYADGAIYATTPAHFIPDVLGRLSTPSDLNLPPPSQKLVTPPLPKKCQSEERRRR